MKKAGWFFFLCCFLQSLLVSAQTDQGSIISGKTIDYSSITVRNATAINSENLEFSPTYYQNGIVYVTAGKVEKRIDDNIGAPFFELFYAELNGAGLPSNPQPFSANVHTSTHEGPISFNFTEDMLYYTSNSDKKNKQGKFTIKIYSSNKGLGDWENKTVLPFNSNEFYTMHPTVTPSGTKLYFASNRPGGFGGTDIYYVEDIGNGWSDPVNLGKVVNTDKNEAFPYIHGSGVLFFASEGHDGEGDYDIYAVDTDQAELKEIIHLKAPFNSPYADFGLILNPTGTQGFFTSARSEGAGQDDVYLFDAQNGLFQDVAPKKITANILIVNDLEIDPVPNAGVYIFEKNQKGLFGKEDLYEAVLEAKNGKDQEMEVHFVRKKELGTPDFFTDEVGKISTELAPNQEYMILVVKKGFTDKEMLIATYGQPSPMAISIPLMTKKCVTLKGKILDGKTENGVPNARINIASNCDNNNQIASSDFAGQYEYCLPVDCDYTIIAEKEGHSMSKIQLSTKQLNKLDLTQNIRLYSITRPPTSTTTLHISSDRLETGATIVLENIYYDFNKSAIRAGAAAELDALATLMLQYPSMEIILAAHTDARGDRAYNRKLSRARAKAAKDYLTRNGIDPKRIIPRGMGEVAIRNHCKNGVRCDEEEHQYNRRTEVRITKLIENVNVRYSGK